MKRLALVFIGVLVLSAILIGCGKKDTEQKVTNISNGNVTNVQKQSGEENKKIESGKDINSIVDSMYNNLYIGEVFKSGFAYIEPFKANRYDIEGEQIVINSYSNTAKLFAIYNGNSFESIYASKFSAYVPDVESDSNYFHQSFSKPKQYGLRYKITTKVEEQSMVISLLNQGILSSDLSIKGNKRPYSKEEYDDALNKVKKDKETRDPNGSLSNIELDSTIVDAKEIGIFSIKDSDIKILLSKYNTHSFENGAVVYVVDFIKDGKVIKTYQKYNWYGV